MGAAARTLADSRCARRACTRTCQRNGFVAWQRLSHTNVSWQRVCCTWCWASRACKTNSTSLQAHLVTCAVCPESKASIARQHLSPNQLCLTLVRFSACRTSTGAGQQRVAEAWFSAANEDASMPVVTIDHRITGSMAPSSSATQPNKAPASRKRVATRLCCSPPTYFLPAPIPRRTWLSLSPCRRTSRR